MTRSAIGSYFSHVRCMTCDHTMPPSLEISVCESCGGAWIDAVYDYEAVASRWPGSLSELEGGFWRYADLLPVHPDVRISLMEGRTPLIPAGRLASDLRLPHLFVKDERQSPTSSFKDRQASLAISALHASGITEVVLASTGNAAAAYAAYAARAGIKIWIFMTSIVPPEKLREAALYGAEVIKVTGTYDQTKAVATNFAARHGYHMEQGAKGVVGKESMKTIAFEIVESLGWQAPDWYIQAVSGGIGPIGVWKGFQELHRMGLIDKLPRLGIIQSDGCSPMVTAWHANSDTAEAVTPRTRIAVLATGDPGYAYTYLYHAAKTGGGTMIAVSDEAAFEAINRLARLEGISVEPATGVAFAGLEVLVGKGVITSEQTVVVNASGHTMPVETFILQDKGRITDIGVSSPLADDWGMPEEGLVSALDLLDEKVTTILVIDDSPYDSRLIRRLLARHKFYRVFEANDAATALAIARDLQPDLLFLDLLMPDMDGFDVLTALKSDERTRDIPVIVVSGKSLSGTERLLLEAHTLSVWTKGSYNTHDLVEYIESELGQGTFAPGDVSPQGEESVWSTLLLIEDNPVDARLLRRQLEALGRIRILEAYSAQQALALLENERPAMIILDLMLPDQDGLSLLDSLRTDPNLQNVPIAVLTGKDLTEEERRRLEVNATHTWIKGQLPRLVLQREVIRAVEEKS